MKIKQLPASVVLVLVGGTLWYSAAHESQLYFALLLLGGLLAGLAGVKPWWAAGALAIIPIAASIYHVRTHRIGICSLIGVHLGLLSIMGAAALSSFVGILLGNPPLRRHLSRIVFGDKRVSLLVFAVFLLPASGFAQTYYYEHAYTVAWPMQYDGDSISHHLFSHRLGDSITWFVLVNNALDKEYMEALGFPALRPHFRIGLRAGF
jgi:hypothetical protein